MTLATGILLMIRCDFKKIKTNRMPEMMQSETNRRLAASAAK
jgi:hypothetical protein